MNQIALPIDAQAIRARRGHRLNTMRSAAAKEHDRHGGKLSAKRSYDSLHRRKRKLAIESRCQHAAPGVKHHERIGTRAHLAREVLSNGFYVHVQHAQKQLRALQHHAARQRKRVARAAAFNHVASERERTARETDERHRLLRAAGQRALAFSNSIKHVLQFRHIWHRQRVDRRFVTQRAREARAFANTKREAEAHRVGHGENVRKQYRSVELVALQRLQQHFGAKRRRMTKLQEAASFGACRAVFR